MEEKNLLSEQDGRRKWSIQAKNYYYCIMKAGSGSCFGDLQTWYVLPLHILTQYQVELDFRSIRFPDDHHDSNLQF